MPQRDSIVEMNRALHLEEASLRDPERIDVLARRMGMVSPEPGQVIRMDTAMPDGAGDVFRRSGRVHRRAYR